MDTKDVVLNCFNSEFPLLRTTAFPRFQNSYRSERQHFRGFRIPIAPNDSISTISEFLSLRTTAFPQSQNYDFFEKIRIYFLTLGVSLPKRYWRL